MYDSNNLPATVPNRADMKPTSKHPSQASQIPGAIITKGIFGTLGTPLSISRAYAIPPPRSEEAMSSRLIDLETPVPGVPSSVQLSEDIEDPVEAEERAAIMAEGNRSCESQ